VTEHDQGLHGQTAVTIGDGSGIGLDTARLGQRSAVSSSTTSGQASRFAMTWVVTEFLREKPKNPPNCGQ
jgi:hypothetical protein